MPLVLAQVTLLSILTHRSWFYVDDFLFLAQGREKRFSISFLRLPLFEHFSPLHRIFDYVLVRSVGLDWSAAHLVLLSLAAACIVAFALVVRSLFASPTLALGLTGAYGASLVFVRNIAWWTGGIHLFLLTVFSLLTILGYVRWHDSGSGRWMVFSLAAYSLALLSHEQAMLVPVYLLLLQVLVLSDAGFRKVVADWRVWGAYGVLTILSLANFLAYYYHPHTTPSPSSVVRFLGVSLFQGFLPTMLAIRIPEAPLVSIPVSVAAGILATAGLVALSLRRSVRAWRAWAFFAASFVVAVLPLGLGRIAIDGVLVGRELHYLTAAAFLGLIAVGAAFDARLAPRRPPGALAEARARRRSRPSPVVGALVPVLAALYLVLYLRDGSRLQHSLWEPVTARTYFNTFEHDLARLRAAGEQPVIVLPGLVPESAVPAWLFPFNSYDHALTLVDPMLRFQGPGPRYSVAVDGHLQPAGPAPTAVEGRP